MAVKFKRTETGKLTRKLNDRLRSYVQNFGEDSPIYQRELGKLDKIIPQDCIKYNKDGVLQVIKPKMIEDLGLTDEIRKIVERQKTPTQIYKEWSKGEDIPKKIVRRIIKDVYWMYEHLDYLYGLVIKIDSTEKSELDRMGFEISDIEYQEMKDSANDWMVHIQSRNTQQKAVADMNTILKYADIVGAPVPEE